MVQEDFKDVVESLKAKANTAMPTVPPSTYNSGYDRLPPTVSNLLTFPSASVNLGHPFFVAMHESCNLRKGVSNYSNFSVIMVRFDLQGLNIVTI